MNELVSELYVHFSVIFTDIEKENNIKFFSKRCLFSLFVEMKEILKIEKNEFVEKLIRVYEKYGVEIFKNSLISYTCIIQIHKYLAANGVETRENEYFLLTKTEIMNSYDNFITIDDLIENNQVLGHKEINPYAKIISSKTNKSYIIDIDDNLYSFGGEKINEFGIKKIFEKVTYINTDFDYLVGIDSECKLWFESSSENRKKISFFNENNKLKFVKIASQVIDGIRILLALSESGGLYQFYRTPKGFFFERKIQKNVIDISGHEELFAYVSKSGQLYVRGKLENIRIMNITMDFITPFPNKVKRVFVYGTLLFVITDEGSVFVIGSDYHGLSGTGKQKQNTFFPVKIQDKIIDISISSSHTLFLSENGKVYGCGRNDYGQIGGNENQIYPILITDNIRLIMAGRHCSLMINELASVKALGKNTDERFGVFTGTDHNDILFIDLLGKIL